MIKNYYLEFNKKNSIESLNYHSSLEWKGHLFIVVLLKKGKSFFQKRDQILLNFVDTKGNESFVSMEGRGPSGEVSLRP